MRANVTLEIRLDAYAPTRNDATVDVSEKLIELLREHCGLYNVIEETPEHIIVHLSLEGDFKEIQP